MSLLSKFVSRSWPDRLLLIRAFFLVSAIRLGLWTLPYRVVRDLADEEVADIDVPRDDEVRRMRRIVGAVEAMSRRLLGTKPCLTQALAAQRLLRQEGLDSTLRIGVSKEGGEFQAHAWLERRDRVIIGGAKSPKLYATLSPTQDESTAVGAI